MEQAYQLVENLAHYGRPKDSGTGTMKGAWLADPAPLSRRS
jgi:hypothetical protein